MSPHKLLLALLSIFLLGVIFTKLAASREFLVLTVLFLFLLSSIFFIWKNKLNYFWVSCFLLASFMLGVFRFTTSEKENQYQKYFGTHIEIEGEIIKDVDVRPSLQLITFRPNNFNQNILLYIKNKHTYFYGDKLWVRGVVSRPEPFNNFDYESYLNTKDTYALIQDANAIVLEKHQGNFVIEKILYFKSWVSKKLTKQISSPENQIVLGTLIGGKSGIPKSIQESFQVAGLSHILSVSGFNITLIVVALATPIYKITGRRFGFWILLIILFIFSLMAGFGASVIRASLMGLLLLIAGVSGRQYNVTPGVVIAGGVMVFLNPLILFHDVGFQLSFLATLGIVHFNAPLQWIFKNIPDDYSLKESAISSISALTATLPLIIYSFGSIHILSVVINTLTLPIVPLIMVAGALSLVPIIGIGFGYLASILVKYVILVTKLATILPYLSLPITFTPILVFLWYASLAMLVWTVGFKPGVEKTKQIW